MLSNFQTDERSLLQTFLLGQPEFRATLHSPGMQQLRQRVIASYHLGPMDAAETRAYVEHRLATVGWQGTPSFDDGAHAAIYAYSGGIPRKTNTLMDRVLLMGYLEELQAFTEAHINDVVARHLGRIRLPPDLDDLAGAHAEPKSAAADGNEPQPGERRASVEQLDERMMRLEKSIVSVLSILKKIAATPPTASALRPTTRTTRNNRHEDDRSRSPAASSAGRKIRNAMTCDVEDYFQVSAFAPYIDRDSWPTRECRVEANIERILALLDERAGVHATFFTLGWIAERYPAAGAPHRRRRPRTGQPRLRPPARLRPEPRRIRRRHPPRQGAAGRHRRPGRRRLPRAEFFDRPRQPVGARRAARSGLPLQLEHLSDRARPLRHARRAALRVLPERPGRHPRNPDHHGAAVLAATCRPAAAATSACCRIALSRWMLDKVNRDDGEPAMFYFHPWEIDTGQPRPDGLDAKSTLSSLRQYRPHGSAASNSWRAISSGTAWTASSWTSA